MGCVGCHSPHWHDPTGGVLLTDSILVKILQKYKDKASCVSIMYGMEDWASIRHIAVMCALYGFKVALYTGHDTVPVYVKSALDYLKTGMYMQELGGLASKRTNQKMVNVKTGRDVTYKFWKLENNETTGATE